jgi:hypothetical protein
VSTGAGVASSAAAAAESIGVSSVVVVSTVVSVEVSVVASSTFFVLSKASLAQVCFSDSI